MRPLSLMNRGLLPQDFKKFLTARAAVRVCVSSFLTWMFFWRALAGIGSCETIIDVWWAVLLKSREEQSLKPSIPRIAYKECSWLVWRSMCRSRTFGYDKKGGICTCVPRREGTNSPSITTKSLVFPHGETSCNEDSRSFYFILPG